MATAEVVTAQSAFSDQETSKAHESTIQQTPPVPQSPQEADKETQVHNKEQEEPPVKDQDAATEHSETKKEEEEVIKPVKEERHEEEVKEKEVFDDNDQSNPTDHHQIAEADKVADKLQEVKTTTIAVTVDSHNKAEKEIKQEEVIISSSKVAPEPADVVEVIPVAEDEKKTQEKGDVAATATATATATERSEENKVDEAADHENKAKENEKDKEVKAEEKVVDAEKIKPDE